MPLFTLSLFANWEDDGFADSHFLITCDALVRWSAGFNHLKHHGCRPSCDWNSSPNTVMCAFPRVSDFLVSTAARCGTPCLRGLPPGLPRRGDPPRSNRVPPAPLPSVQGPHPQASRPGSVLLLHEACHTHTPSPCFLLQSL